MANGVTNEAFTTEVGIIHVFDDMTTSNENIKLEDQFSIRVQNATILSDSTTKISPKIDDITTNETERVEFVLEQVTKSPIQKFNLLEVKALPKTIPSQMDHSKLNEISSVDDIKHTCVERHEPNGTVYFVEVDLIQGATKNEMINDEVNTAEFEESIDKSTEELERSIVERVLGQSDDTDLRPKSEPNLVILSVPSECENSDTEEEEKEVRAIVHASNELSTTSELSDSTSIESSITFERSLPSIIEFPPLSERKTSPGVIRPIDVSEKSPYSRQSPNFQIGIYEAFPRQKLLYENDKDRLAFKMRLENLFSQSGETTDTLNRTKSIQPSPTQPHFTRLSALNHSISAPDSLTDETISNKPPSFEEVSLEILIPPPAPEFNQELFNTVGRRNRKAFSSASASDVIDIDDTIKDCVPPESVNKKAHLSRTKAHENLAQIDVENNEPPNIKQKLEEIFSKGRAATQLDEPVDFEASRNSNNENIRRSKRLEPFDTVRKQKMLFSDVLKSIGPDIHSNLHPTRTTAAIDIQETQRRESLD